MRIIIADDHALFRDGLKLLLASRPEYAIVGECGNAAELRELVRRQQPQLILLDYNMPGGEIGAELVYLKQRHPEILVLILTAERSGVLLKHLLDAGADGILLKEGSGEAMLAAIRQIGTGRKVVPDNVRALIESADLQLSAREFQVLHLIGQGWSNAEIAVSFSLSVRTVDKHRENLQRKLGASNAVQLINKARELGLLEKRH